MIIIKDKLRKSLGKTQEQVCKEINVSQTTLSRLEKNEHDNGLIRYLTYLVKEGADINEIFKDSWI